ncbi:MAG TPA: hypothetical protein VJ547_02155 [Candidatus Thermoplasmatota archaeon]|nr:hypothetical protein [Candidatus Thermoplasmatota archaeon]
MNGKARPPAIEWRPWGLDTMAEAGGSGRPVLVRLEGFGSREARRQREEGDADGEVIAAAAAGFVALIADGDRDPEVALHLGGRRTPVTAVLDETGAVRASVEGAIGPEAFLRLLEQSAHPRGGPDRGPALARTGRPVAPDLKALAEALLAPYDWRNHGFGTAPKEPSGEALETALAVGRRVGTPFAGKAALLSLSALPKTEAFDAVEGGFFRECAGERWQEPSFEKRLDVNAALLSAYASAFAATGGAEHRRVALETAAYVDRGLSTSEGHLWSPSQAADEEYYAKMAHRRAIHGAPPVDPTVCVEACASAASAFARAGLCLEEPRLVARAQIALDELFEAGALQGDRAFHYRAEGAWRGGRWLPDHTELGRAALEVYCATGRAAWLERAAAMARALLPAFGDPEGAGLFSLRDTARAPGALASLKSPAHTARASLFLQRVGECLGDARLIEEGRRLAEEAPAALPHSMPADAPLVGALLSVTAGVVVIEGPDPKGALPAAKLTRAALALALPLGAFTLGGAPHKERNEGDAVAFRVRGRRSEPVGDAAGLTGALASVTRLCEVP